MALIVVVVGVLMIGAALAMLASPDKLRTLLHGLLKPRWLPMLSALRIAVGILFILAAPHTRLPMLVWLIGLVAIVAGIIILFLGAARTQLLANWWLNRSNASLRLWAGSIPVHPLEKRKGHRVLALSKDVEGKGSRVLDYAVNTGIDFNRYSHHRRLERCLSDPVNRCGRDCT